MNIVVRRKNQSTPHKTTNNTASHLNDEITKKNQDMYENHLFILKQREKDK